MAKKYNIIYADPPWRYESGTADPRDSIENHYPTMSIPEIKAMRSKILRLAAEDCILFLWSPVPKLSEAIKVLEYWCFTYRSAAFWNKGSIGLGYWVRQQHEVLLIGIKGRPHPPKKKDRHSSEFKAKRRRHSQKPDEVREWIDKAYPNKRKLELFAREKAEGWDVWGNEVEGIEI